MAGPSVYVSVVLACLRAGSANYHKKAAGHPTYHAATSEKRPLFIRYTNIPSSGSVKWGSSIEEILAVSGVDDAFLSFFDFSSYSSNSFLWLMFATLPLLYRLCIEKFGLRTCPKTFLQCFALEHSITYSIKLQKCLRTGPKTKFFKQSPTFVCVFLIFCFSCGCQMGGWNGESILLES